MDLAEEFPIESQTSQSDKLVLLRLRDLLHDTGAYTYVEIGSFLGGSLTPFLRDPHCSRILSIDDRGRAQPDERGVYYDYAGILEQTMLDNLKNAGLKTDKLSTFDGSIETMPPGAERFDFAFIDGEHTDVACFRDFVRCQALMKTDHIVAFHDSTLIHKALAIIIELLEATGRDFRFIKVRDSEMSVVLFGRFCRLGLEREFAVESDLPGFYRRSEDRLLNDAIANRVDWTCTLKPRPTLSAF